MTDQNVIPLSPDNNQSVVVPVVELSSSYIELEGEEVQHRLDEIAGRRLTVLYQSLGNRECSLVGVNPEGNIEDVRLLPISIVRCHLQL